MAGEASELTQLATDLGRIPPNALTNVRKAVEVAARNIKDAWGENLQNATGSSLRHTTYSVDYDLTTNIGAAEFGGLGSVGVAAEIGPNLGRVQGPMAGWFESGNVDGVPQTRPGDAALKANGEDFANGLGIAITDAVRDAL